MGRSRAGPPASRRLRSIVRFGVRGPAASALTMAARLVISPLASTSPTLADEMRGCRLRAGLASCREAASWVLHDPRLWLGTALHALLEKARHEHIPDLEAAWDDEIAGFVERIGSHQFDRRFSDP